MKALVFTDIHGKMQFFDALKKKAEHADVILCTGDFTVFEQQTEKVLYQLHKFGKPVFLIHGNHELAQNVDFACRKYPEFVFLHKKAHLLGDCLFMGFGGGGFSFVDREFERHTEYFVKKMKQHPQTKKVLLLHGPPYGTALDEIYTNQHCGNKSYLSFIRTHKPDYVFAGHIHECFCRHQVMGKTYLLNPGPAGALVVLQTAALNG